MFIGWLQEWFDSLKEKYNNQEVIEYTNEAIHDIRKHTYDCINTLEEARDYYAENQNICPFCGCDEFIVDKSYEQDDLDGNRGIFLKTYKCTNCQEEI